MRRPVCALFIFATVICAAQPASAQSASIETPSPSSPWYVEGSAGALLRFDASRSTTFFNSVGATGPGVDTITFDPGYVLNFGVGYKLPLGFRIEVEGGYAHYSAATVSPLSTNGAFPALNGSSFALQSGGGRDEYSATFNGFYDLPISWWIVPYVGAGVGVNTIYAQTGHFMGPSGGGIGAAPQFTQEGGTATNAAVLAEVGLTITLNANWAIVPSYRFQKVLTSGGDFSNQANIFKLGLRYSL